MKSRILQKARKYEAEAEKQISIEERPVFHLSPRTGWMNDPNGFVYFEGKYHLFYQYYPYGTFWGPMHWGHAVSEDLVHWEYLPAALAPDSKNDKEGCFSGCGVVTDDGRLALVYTGVRKMGKNISDKSKNVQIQCLAMSKDAEGIDFEKNSFAVIESEQVPQGCSIEDFRDPKVVRTEDGSFLLYAVNKNEEGKGQVLAYKSKDLKKWDYCGCVLKNVSGPGVMWECPDLFTLDGKAVLMMSAQEIEQSEDLDPGSVGVCLIGNYDKAAHKFTHEKTIQVDRGLDFYAQQTVQAPDGRHIMIGWLQNWDICNYRIKNTKWFGQMSFPREIKIEKDLLIQQPAREIEQFWKNKKEIKALKLFEGKQVLSEINGNCLDLTIVVRKYDSEMSYFAVNLFEGNGHFARVYYDFRNAKAGVGRSHAGVKNALLSERSCAYKPEENELKIRIIVDRFSVEAFFGEGELAMSMCIYDEKCGSGVSVEALGSAEIDVLGYEIS